MVNPRVSVLLEVGRKRTFASAVDWPGWARAGTDEARALEALVAYGPRYRRALGAEEAEWLELPLDVQALDVVERVEGDATTDFGAPGMPGTVDDRPVGDAELDRLTRILSASWGAFDRSAESAAGVELRKGPRGGGRDVGRIVEHVYGADASYLTAIGGRRAPELGADLRSQMSRVREAALQALRARARGEPPPPSRRTSPLWTPRYFCRRSAWHALDHAWEIEDRAN